MKYCTVELFFWVGLSEGLHWQFSFGVPVDVNAVIGSGWGISRCAVTMQGTGVLFMFFDLALFGVLLALPNWRRYRNLGVRSLAGLVLSLGLDTELDL